MLAAEVGGQRRFDVEADTVGSALRSLPVANLVFDERGQLRQLVNVYVDGRSTSASTRAWTRASGSGGLPQRRRRLAACARSPPYRVWACCFLLRASPTAQCQST